MPASSWLRCYWEHGAQGVGIDQLVHALLILVPFPSSAPLHGITYSFFSDRDRLCTLTNLTTKYLVFPNNRPAMFSPLALPFSSVVYAPPYDLFNLKKKSETESTARVLKKRDPKHIRGWRKRFSNWTKQDKTCEFSRKSSFSKLRTKHGQKKKKKQLIHLAFVRLMLGCWRKYCPIKPRSL